MPSYISSVTAKIRTWAESTFASTSGITTEVIKTNRGTDNPHVGAHPHQPWNTIDNRDKSAYPFIEGGKLYVGTAAGIFQVPLGWSVKEDDTEPDIETTNDSGQKASLVTGDLDSNDPYGQPFRGGYRNPDIGANQCPVVITSEKIGGDPYAEISKILKLQRKDFWIVPSMVGTSSDVTAFKKYALQGMELFCTDTKDKYVAETSADGTTDATLSKFTPAATGQ